MSDKPKYYELFLPVFKQGDDLSRHLSENPSDSAQAFLDFASRYEDAASVCRRVAGVIKESGKMDSIEIEADTHHIGFVSPEGVFEGLVKDKFMQVPDWLDEEEGFDEGFDECFDDECDECLDEENCE